jgi:4-diphosphocytidyl-2-C-methyl-D-erythritol kinase
MTVFASPAKINLFLRVVGRRADGYHEIETVFQRLDWGDRLDFEKGDTPGCELLCQNRALDCDPRENLIAKAYHALREHVRNSETLPGVRVVLDKRLPAGGGLGGGSSNAATTLGALNQSLGLGVEPSMLARIALSLGADVPFFLGPPCAIGRGVGECLTPARHHNALWALLALPAFGVSTAEVYARYDAAHAHATYAPWPEGVNSRTPGADDLVCALWNDDLDGVLALMHNDLEAPAFHVAPALGTLHAQLEGLAGQPVRVTGSGSTLFTLVRTRDEAERMAGTWKGLTEVRIARFEVAE